MKLWKLILHHTDAENAWNIVKTTNTLAIGWECVGDMRTTPYASSEAIKELIRQEYPDLGSQNHSNGGHSLWDFFHTMKPGDIVLVVAAGKRRGAIIVTGDYAFVPDGTSYDEGYPHQRSGRIIGTEQDADLLWKLHEVSEGASPYRTLLPLAN